MCFLCATEKCTDVIQLPLFDDLFFSDKHTAYYNSPRTSFYVLPSWEWTWMSSDPFILLTRSCFTLTEVTCKTKAQADIVLLVDGSWSIGRLNFKTIRSFIARMVGVFDIGPDKVQVGGYHTTPQGCLRVMTIMQALGNCCNNFLGGIFQVWLSTVATQRLNGI